MEVASLNHRQKEKIMATRRSFLQGTAAIAGSMALAAQVAQAKESNMQNCSILTN
jgi:hypothetical protein